MEAAQQHGTLVSYDLNYRPSLWKSIGGKKRAQEVNRELAALRRRHARQRGGLHGRARLRGRGRSTRTSPALDPANFRKMIEQAVRAFPNFQVVATTLRDARTATINDWGASCSGRTASSTRRAAARASRSATASAAATPSPPGSSTASWPARARSGRSSAARPTARSP